MNKPKQLVTSFERSTNGYGRTIYVEEWLGNTGRPRIWYEIDKENHVVKYVRGLYGIARTVRGKSRYV